MESEILSQLRLLKIYAAAMTVVFAVLCLTALAPSTHKQKFGEIDAERINIVDANGSPQLIISNKDRFPEPVANGRELKGMRSVRPAGLVFYDAKGNEAGGLATFQMEKGKNSLIAFDYATAEAIGFSRFESDECAQNRLSMARDTPIPAHTSDSGVLVGAVGSSPRLTLA